MNRPDDDAGLAAFLTEEADKPPVAPYREYASTVLTMTAAALAEGWPAAKLQAEYDYAYAVLEEGTAPYNPCNFRDRLMTVVEHHTRVSPSPSRLLREVESLLSSL